MQRPADIVDCDIHPAVRSMADLEPWLDRQWIDHYRTYVALRQTHYVTGAPYHKSQPNASRRDAYPPEGGPQGSSPDFLATQHLDANGISVGVLNPLVQSQGVRNLAHSAALCRASISCGIVEPTSGTWMMFFLAASTPLRMASGIARALPRPAPTYPLRSPTMTSAFQLIVRPPLCVF